MLDIREYINEIVAERSFFCLVFDLFRYYWQRAIAYRIAFLAVRSIKPQDLRLLHFLKHSLALMAKNIRWVRLIYIVRARARLCYTTDLTRHILNIHFPEKRRTSDKKWERWPSWCGNVFIFMVSCLFYTVSSAAMLYLTI